VVDHLPEFLAVAILVIVTPGQDTALTIRNTLFGGRPGGVATAIGVSLGQLTWAVVTSVGAAALLRASEPAFLALRLLGAAYLIFIGAQALIAALRRSGPPASQASSGGARLRPSVALRQGLLSNLGNPKMAAFFPSVLPQFVVAPEGAFFALLALGALFSAMTLTWLVAYTFVVARAGDFLRRDRPRRVVEGIMGTVLVAFGVRLAASST